MGRGLVLTEDVPTSQLEGGKGITVGEGEETEFRVRDAEDGGERIWGKAEEEVMGIAK